MCIKGNITIGDGAKIGAGSIVLKPIPHGATAVGAPAKVIGWARENNPGSMVDNSLQNIVEIDASSEESATESTEREFLTDDSSTELGEKKSGLAQDVEGENTIKKSSFSKEGVSVNDSEKEKAAQNESEVEQLLRSDNSLGGCKMLRGGGSNSLCVFRRIHSRRRGELSYSNMYDSLSDFCSEAEIGEVYMELLKQEKSKEHFSRREAAMHFPSILQQYTNLDNDKCQVLQKRLSLDLGSDDQMVHKKRLSL